MNLVLVGPCGVGQSTVATSLANRANMIYLDFDALRIADMQKRKGHVSPFTISAKKRSENEFDEIWENWLDIAEPYWQPCGDTFIDTSFLAVDDVVAKIEAMLNRSIRLI